MLKSQLESYKPLIDEQLAAHMDYFGPETPLKEACRYALLNGGKRFRPALVLMIAKSLDSDANAMKAALATEFFHVSTLIADDLPCMDDDDMRRGKPSTHIVYGENVAIMATYALIAAGFEFIVRCAKENGKTELCHHAVMNATKNAGILGVTGGQFLDLNPPGASLEDFKEVLKKKTVALFETAFVFGWLFGGGKLSCLSDVEQAAYHFGMAFQIADDIGDMEQDRSRGQTANIANTFGKERAIEMFHVEQQAFANTVDRLKIDGSELIALLDSLNI